MSNSSLARSLAKAISEMDVRCVPADARKNRRRTAVPARGRSVHVRQVPQRTRLGKGHSGDILCTFIIARSYEASSIHPAAGRSLPMHLIEDGSRSTLANHDAHDERGEMSTCAGRRDIQIIMKSQVSRRCENMGLKADHHRPRRHYCMEEIVMATPTSVHRPGALQYVCMPSSRP